MKRFALATAAAVTLVSGLSQPAAAAGPITSLDECYDAVITWCNETFPDHDCSSPSGLDECDEVFATYGNPTLHLQTRPNDPVARLMVLVNGTRPADRGDNGRGGDDRGSDDHGDRGSPSDRGGNDDNGGNGGGNGGGGNGGGGGFGGSTPGGITQ